MAIKDNMISSVLKVVVRRVNASCDLIDIMHRYNADGRTMVIVITDLDEGIGFSVSDDKLSTGIIENPTCVVKMTKAVLAAIVTGKITQQQAFLMGGVEIHSNERLRDSITLNRIFDEMKTSIVK